ncbi:uncharacterized protein LOC114875689 [Osmia bicornis bicornis]|uniref:uncharacterized protein LOC114875689 n=1 Tax=Osmia bicornis bicornis TaxID=1437191 RepID=UPI001EAEBBEC|nr:uncharacterized protein LOC114875689 [Osmia bicornis bicornis]
MPLVARKSKQSGRKFPCPKSFTAFIIGTSIFRRGKSLCTLVHSQQVGKMWGEKRDLASHEKSLSRCQQRTNSNHPSHPRPMERRTMRNLKKAKKHCNFRILQSIRKSKKKDYPQRKWH